MTSVCSKSIPARTAQPSQIIPLQPLVQTPPLPQCEVCVVVPVQNEAKRLEGTLTALTDQIDLKGYPLDPVQYEVILLANNCSDDSAVIANRFASQHPNLVLHVVERTLPASKANIGWVRKRLMDEAYHRMMLLGRYKGIIASTDGDTQVAPTWIATTSHEIACGADAVGGRIITNRCDRTALDPYARACYLREVGYRFLVAELEAYLNPDPFDGLPRHFQHYGASLAVTAEIYEQAGGLPLAKTSEDVALYRALRRVDARFRHSSLVRVTTSARQVGRARSGLADQLSAWAVMGRQQQAFLVEPAGVIATRFRAQHELRLLWQRCLSGDEPTPEEAALPANRLGINCDWLMHELSQHASLGALYEAIEQRQEQEGIWQKRWSFVRIEQAIYDLRLLLAPLRSQSNKFAGSTKALPLVTPNSTKV